MRLYLMRHGIAAEPDDPRYTKDDERPLTPRGMRRTLRAVRGLVLLDIEPDLILTSPLLRARQTAEIVARALQFPDGRIELTKSLLPEKRPKEFVEQLKTREAQAKEPATPSVRPGDASSPAPEPGKTSVSHFLCVGHAPNLDLVIAALISPDQRPFTALQKCAVACLERSTDEENRESWELLWLLSPRQLRKIGSNED